MLQAPLPPTRTDSPVRTIQQQSGDRTSENVELAVLQKCLCDGEFTHCDEMTEHIRAGQTRAVSGVAERADLSPRRKVGGGKKSQDKGKGVMTVKPKERLRCVTSSKSKSEFKYFSAEVCPTWQNKSVRQREVDSGSGKRRCSGGTGMASLVHRLDVCFLC